MNEPVVVGVDGSASALDAVRWAAGEARHRHTSLRIVHAHEIPVGYPPGFVDWHALHQALAAQGRSWLDQARARPANICFITRRARSWWSVLHRRLTVPSVDCRAGYAEFVCPSRSGAV